MTPDSFQTDESENVYHSTHQNIVYVKCKRKILRYRNYDAEDEPSNFYRSNLMLFLPWRDEHNDILNIDMKAKYLDNEAAIGLVKDSFIKTNLNFKKVDEIISDIEKEIENFGKNNKNVDEEIFKMIYYLMSMKFQLKVK